MARIDRHQIERLKRNVSILHVCAERGIELKRHGTTDYIGKCPLHDDKNPSFVVTPSKNLFHCMGCDAGGSVIDLVMKLDNISFMQAVDKLIVSTGVVSRGAASDKSSSQTSNIIHQTSKITRERANQLLDRVTAIYEQTFSENDAGKKYLESRGITDTGLLARHSTGYSDGQLKEMLPGNGGVCEELAALGVLHSNNGEHFHDCVIFPVYDVEGNIVTLYGRAVSLEPSTVNGERRRHFFLPDRPKGIWNIGIIKSYTEIFVVESVIDALSLEMAGYPNVIAIHGTGNISDETLDLFREQGITRINLLLDADPAGCKATERILSRLPTVYGLQATALRALPEDHDPNSYLTKHGAEKLRELIEQQISGGYNEPARPAAPCNSGLHGSGPGQASLDRRSSPQANEDGSPSSSSSSTFDFRPSDLKTLSFSFGPRRYTVMGLEKGPRKLKATIRVEHSAKLHVDTLDFYSARSRRMLAQDLCRIFEETPETIEGDITRLLKELERVELDKLKPETQEPKVPPMTPERRAEAEAFGKRPDLIPAILMDFELCGLIGEEPNKVLGYVAMTSRKRPEPLSVLILSSSGAGKTALQDAVVGFCPPEDLVKLTALSGKALFYKERMSLKHKVLALEEGDGAEEAMYAIRNLISSGSLVSESTIKDLATGRLTTMENRVEGPSSVLFTTTNPEVDPETKSRFWVTSIDESRDQTRRILAFQRSRQTGIGSGKGDETDAALCRRRHHDFQRLLQPVAVVNPYAARLSYGDDRLQGRRDQPKYLELINAVAFLRQMMKEVKTGKSGPYIEVDLEDIRIANQLANEVLGHSLDELSRPGRALLEEIDKMLKEQADESPEGEEGTPGARRSFSRRELREHTGWTNTRLHIHLKELVEFEYIVIESGRNGMPYRYRLAWDGRGRDGGRFMLGLVEPEELE